MNFFEAQDSARRSTTLLVILFALAIAGLLALSNLIVFQFFYYLESGRLTSSLSELEAVFDGDLSVLVSTAIIGFICLGSLYKLATLSSGGQAIALSLGGIIVPRSSTDPLHKKILNIVEEMAIASGTPVPQVYILNEQGINAFAAGWKTTTAVIGITQGALERLTRDELQGVIAHEFSHIFNGDMRLNIRLIAILHGILMIGMLGRMILRSMRYVRTSRNSKDGRVVLMIFAIAAALMVLGYIGTFFGNWIKSLISRQREYLADASAVQFTRSSEGIANALKKIGGAIPGSAISAVAADIYSHAYFARGDNGPTSFLFSTHPPLKKRILRIQPNWDGKYIFDDRKPVRERYADVQQDAEKQQEKQDKRQRTKDIGYALGTGVTLHEALNALDNIGEISQQKIDAAHEWRRSLPEVVLAHAENPYGAQALVLALLLHHEPEIEKKQYAVLNEVIGELHTQNVIQVQQLVSELARTQALPLVDLALPTLREMNVEQYRRFKLCLQKLILADGKVDLREWIVQRVVIQHLDEQYALRKKPSAKYFVLGSAKQASEIMLSMLAYIEHPDEAAAIQAFAGAKRAVGAGALQILPKSKVSIGLLDMAMDDLQMLKPPLKRRFLQACVSCISHDGKVTLQAYELTRAIASCLDCPMPPVLVNES
jgi:Zn-dependent protease with chaperone function